MSTRYIRRDLVHVNMPARQTRVSDRKKHAVTVRYVDPKPQPTREQVKRRTLLNDGLRAHNDLRARLYA